MSDTPRTDAEMWAALDGRNGWSVVDADFARQLERELEETERLYSELSTALVGDKLLPPLAEVARLQRELAGARKDAQRLEWLMNGGIDRLPYRDHGAGPEFDLSRAAIDAAMRTTAPRP